MDRGTTWSHIASTNAGQNPTWKTINGLYIDPIIPGRYIVASSIWDGSGTVISEDNMQTWRAIVSGERIL